MSDDLVRRLRSNIGWVSALGLGDPCKICSEAADRIEALEAGCEKLEAMQQVATDVHLANHTIWNERISELETRIVGLVEILVDGQKREQELEATLREIADYQPPKPTIEELEVLLREEPTEPVHINTDGSVSRNVQVIARRALERKS